MRKNVSIIAFITFIFCLFFAVSCTPGVEPVNYNVTFDLNNGAEPKIVSVMEKSCVEFPEDPQKEGWEFKGWYTENDVVFEASTPITSDLVLKAKYTGTAFFYVDKNADPKEVKFTEGEAVTPPTVEGYEEISYYWSENKNATQESKKEDEFDLSKVSKSPLTLYVISAKVVTVTFDYNYEKAESSSKEVEINKTLTKPGNPKHKENFYYKFSYWYEEKGDEDPKDYEKPFDFETPLTKDITLKAKWNAYIGFISSVGTYNGQLVIYNGTSYVREEDCSEFKATYITDDTEDNSGSKELSIKFKETKDEYIYFTFEPFKVSKKTKFSITVTNGIEKESYDISVSKNVEQEEPSVKESDYLVIMYMDGDNNLNDPIFMDMNEVEYGLSQIRNTDGTPKTEYVSVNVVALWDGWSGDGTNNPQIGKKGTYIYELGTDYGCDTTWTTSSGCVLSSKTKDLTSHASWIKNNEVNMGDKQTLINFLNWVNERYKAGKVILQFANHGGGPRYAPTYAKTEDGYTVKLDNAGRRALCWDDNSYSVINGESFLKTKDVSDALSQAGYGKNNQLDMILMDVCLGASIEDAYQFKDYAKYMVASPNNVGEMGMDYSKFIQSFKRTATIESIGKQLINDFKDNYKFTELEWMKIQNDLSTDGIYPNLNYVQFFSMAGVSTLSMIDLSKIDALEDSITSLATFLLSNKDKIVSRHYFNENGDFVPEEPENPVPYLDLLRDYVRYSGTTGNSLYYMGSYSWLFDIGYMMDNFIVISSAQIKDKQNNIISNPYEWTELIPYCESVKGALEDTIIDAWRDSPVDQNLYNDVLQGTHYGLTISGETIAIDGNNFVPGTCPDFYESDLVFGADSVWTDLLVEWFGE